MIAMSFLNLICFTQMHLGLLIRHLVLPNNAAHSREVLKFIAEEISRNTYVNIMDQYRPEHKACDYKELSRRPTLKEYTEVVRIAEELGLKRSLTFRHAR